MRPDRVLMEMECDEDEDEDEDEEGGRAKGVHRRVEGGRRQIRSQAYPRISHVKATRHGSSRTSTTHVTPRV